MAAVMLQALPSYYSNYSDKSLFISSSFNKYDNLLVTNEYCVASHNDSPCTLKNCNYHILLVTHKDVDDILGKLDSYCYLYQRVDCFYTLYKHYFYGNIIAKNGNIFNLVQRAVSFNQGNKGVDRMPSIAKKRLQRKKFKKHLLSSMQKTVSTQTNGSVFVQRIERVRKTRYEIELFKIVDCFLDGYGNYESSLVCFKIKTLI